MLLFDDCERFCAVRNHIDRAADRAQLALCHHLVDEIVLDRQYPGKRSRQGLIAGW